MTEKQFEVVFNGSDFQLRNNENNEELHLTDEKVCYDYIADLLNCFHEENEQLKKQIGNLEHTRDFCAECCERLEKENEQLKSEIREVRGEYEQLWMRFYDY